MDRQSEKAEELLRLHRAPELLVLVNVWDAVSARTVAALPGCRALATASASIAAAYGVPDHEVVGPDAMLAAVGRIAAAVELPVSADLERGYGPTAADVGETVARAIHAGAVGANLEDGTGYPEDPLRDAGEHAERVAAARDRADDEGIPMVLNARTDVVLAGDGDLGAAVERGRAYLAAGADCVFVPGVRDADAIATLVREMGGPVSLLAGPGSPPLHELEALGVARATFGSGTLAVAMSALHDAAERLLGGDGGYPDALRFGR